MNNKKMWLLAKYKTGHLYCLGRNVDELKKDYE